MAQNDKAPEQKKVTRIDMYERGNQGVYIEKYTEGWTAGSPAVSRDTNTENTLGEMVAWLRENGWRVYEWPGGGPGSGGARAFLGRPYPVRTRWGIQYKRQHLEAHPFLWAADERPKIQIDLALEY